MRFVVVCRNGHLDDVPWEFWAHTNAKTPQAKQCRSLDLSFNTLPSGGTGLASLEVRCHTCGNARSLSEIASKDSLAPYKVRCPGRQPWQRQEHGESCPEIPQVLQRGATNVYFAHTRSALDIPPGSAHSSWGEVAVDITNTSEYDVIRSNPNGVLVRPLAEQLAGRFGITVERVLQIVRAELQNESGMPTDVDPPEDLGTEEWNAFLADHGESDPRDRFITRPAGFVAEPPESGSALGLLAGRIDRVVLATRLREVRALVGFSRYDPDGRRLAPDLGRGLDWLPAIEVFGEGIFLSLSEERVRRWETDTRVRATAERLERRRRNSLFGPRLGAESTPRFLLLHTLAHLLVRQLAFDCGYAASSLRERIYAKEPTAGDDGQAGILVYTAAGDVEGTLGGLVRQGKPPRLAGTLLRALEAARWCSSDPLCGEGEGQGFQALNLGACYACSLVAETSCAYFNVLLDRGFVVGSHRMPGFFDDVVDAALTESSLRVETR